MEASEAIDDWGRGNVGARMSWNSKPGFAGSRPR